MLTRIIAALALLPLFIFILIGGLPLYIAEIVILAIALREFYKAFNAKDIHPIQNIGYIFVAAIILCDFIDICARHIIFYATEVEASVQAVYNRALIGKNCIL